MIFIGNKINAVDFKFDFTYNDVEKAALTDISGSVARGSCLVLCGGSGCGKTTLLRCINRLIPQFYEGKLTGFCLIDGKDISTFSIGEVGKLAASVFQDPRSQFFTTDSSSEVAFGLENHGLNPEEIIERVNYVYRESGLDKLKDRNVFELSSGERQLVAILSAWALNVPLLLLDEPTANLDYAAIEYLKELLKRLKSLGYTLIINEHRLYYLRDIADEYLLIEQGKLKARLSCERLLSLSEKELAELSLRAIDLSALEYTCAATETDIKKYLELRGIQFGYNRQDGILRDVCLKAETGEVIGIIGSNGCGKTTLGKLIAGLYKPTAGEICFGTNKLSKRELADNAIFIMQEAEFQFFTNSVINELEYGRTVTPELREIIKSLLVRSDLWEIRERHPFTLSGGQMQKLALLTNLILLNFLWIICSLPIITMGAATTAMNSVIFQYLDSGNDAVIKPFFKAFVSNFRQSTLIGLPLSLLAGMLVFDGLYLVANSAQGFQLLWLPCILLALLCGMLATYAFPIIARYECRIQDVIRNSFLLFCLELFSSLFLLFLNAIPIILLVFFPDIFMKTSLFWVMLGRSLTAFLSNSILLRIFKKHDRLEEKDSV